MRTNEASKTMKNTMFFFCLFLLSAILAGCAPKEKVINGQAFIVTEDAQNIKLGLVEVFLLDEMTATNLAAQVQKRAETQILVLRSEIELARLKLTSAKTNLLEYSRTNYTVSSEFQSDSDWIEKCRVNIALFERKVESDKRRSDSEWNNKMREQNKNELIGWIDSLDSRTSTITSKLEETSKEVLRLRGEIEKTTDLVREREKDLAVFSPIAFYLKESPVSLKARCTTDADGKFSLSIPTTGRFAILAQASREIGSTTEHYAWFCWISAPNEKQDFFLSNNNLSTASGTHNVMPVAAGIR